MGFVNSTKAKPRTSLRFICDLLWIKKNKDKANMKVTDR